MVGFQEIIPFVIASVVLWLGVRGRLPRDRRPGRRELVAAFVAFYVSALATFAEHFALPALFDLVEHLGRATMAVLVLVACVKFARRRREVEP